jgi:hypothetical protein
MGLSSFLKGSAPTEVISAFDQIPEDARQHIANDLVAIIECVKCWKAAVQSPEHGRAMVEEAKAVGRKLMTKGVSMAMTGKDDFLSSPDWYKNLGLPQAIVNIIDLVIGQIKETELAARKTTQPTE